MGLAIDLYVDLINVPAPVAEAAHPAHPLAAYVRGEYRAEAIPPQPHCLMAEVYSALVEQVLHVPQREWKDGRTS